MPQNPATVSIPVHVQINIPAPTDFEHKPIITPSELISGTSPEKTVFLTGNGEKVINNYWP